MDIKKIRPSDSDYLRRLDFLEDPPKKLYYYGELPENNAGYEGSARFPKEIGRPKTVAIVGSRKMTEYGKNIAYKIARELAENEVIIVSGMATGIDSMAHEGAMAGGGKTLAFLGTEIDNIYPKCNINLFERIITSHGAVFSEYPPGEKLGMRLKANSFLHRNRLISGISDAVVIVEADLRSGSLNTASHALEQGVPVFAVPGDWSRQMSRGCNGLFNKGASACTSSEDILKILFEGKTRKIKQTKVDLGNTEDEKKIIKLLKRGVYDGEEILKELKITDPEFNISRFNISITTLEIRGVIKRGGGNLWILC